MVGLASKSSFLKFSIAQSNLACVLLEVYGPNHPTGSSKYLHWSMYVGGTHTVRDSSYNNNDNCSDASFLLEGSAKMIMDSLGGS